MRILNLFVFVLLSISCFAQSKDTVSIDKLKRTYKSQLITGSLELATGITCVGLFFYFHDKTSISSNGNTQKARINLFVGAVFSGIGIYSIAKGSSNRSKYYKLRASPTSASLTIHF